MIAHNIIQQSFLEDMNDSTLLDSVLNGYGAAIDHIVTCSKTTTSLFESKQEREDRESFANLSDNEDDEMFDDGMMIDSIIKGGK